MGLPYPRLRRCVALVLLLGWGGAGGNGDGPVMQRFCEQHPQTNICR